MQLTIQGNGLLARLALPEQFVFSTHVAFRQAMRQIHASGLMRILELDFARVAQMDSAALGMLRCVAFDDPRYAVRLLNARQDMQALLEMAQLQVSA